LWAAAFINWRRWPHRVPSLLVVIAATLAPLAALAVAWDLSRFLVWANLAAALVLIGSGCPTLFARGTDVPAAGRTAHAWVLNGTLAAISVFYLLSPAIFAYVSEVSMSYGSVPLWFARTAPARVTERIFDRYNVNAPRTTRFRRQAACFLDDRGATRLADCLHEIRCDDLVLGPENLKLVSGAYTARFRFSGDAACGSGVALVQVATSGRFGRVLADDSRSIEPGNTVELPFQLSLMDAALAPVEFRVGGISGCVLLSGVEW
jgi:hypothetical protein